MARIVIIDGPDTGKSFVIEDCAGIGTDPRNEVTLTDRRAAPEHSVIQLMAEQFEIRELESNKGLEINGEPVHKTILRHGDMITIGDTKLLFSEEDRPTDSTEQDPLVDSQDSVLPPHSQVLSRVDSIKDTKSLFDKLPRPSTRSRRLLTLYRVGQVLHGKLEIDPMLEELMMILFEEFPADRGLILLEGKSGGSLQVQIGWDRKEGRIGGPISYSQTIVQEVMEKREAVLTENAMDDTRFQLGQSIVDQSIVSALCVPLVRRGRSFGAIQLHTHGTERAFTDEDLEQLIKIGFQAAVAIQNSLTYAEPERNANVLKSLSRATLQLSRYLEDRNAILTEGVSYACCLLGCRLGSILLASKRTGKLHVVNSFNRSLDPSFSTEPGMESLAGWVFSNNLPLLMPSRDPQYGIPEGLKPTHRSRYRTNSFIILPIHRTSQDGSPPRVIGVFNITDKLNGKDFTKNDLKILQILIAQVGIALTNARLYEKATVDSLTRLYVRRYFFDKLQKILLATAPDGSRASLLMLDLDNFKAKNDDHGHRAGDLVLRETGQIVRSCCRESDVAARYGGEEFVILLPATSTETAKQVAERIRRSIEEHAFNTSEFQLRATVSIGVATAQESETRESLIGKADKALYAAKANGKNRVVCYDE